MKWTKKKRGKTDLVGAVDWYTHKKLDKLVQEFGYNGRGLGNHHSMTGCARQKVGVYSRQVKVVDERVQVELLSEETNELVDEGETRGWSIACAVAELHAQVDLLDVHGDVKKAVLLNPFYEMIRHRLGWYLLLLLWLLLLLSVRWQPWECQLLLWLLLFCRFVFESGETARLEIPSVLV